MTSAAPSLETATANPSNVLRAAMEHAHIGGVITSRQAPSWILDNEMIGD